MDIGLGTSGEGRDLARRLTVACVQLSARDLDESERALEEAVSAAREAGRHADVVVLPEATYPAYVLHDRNRSDWGRAYRRGLAAFSEVARDTSSWVYVGLVRPDRDERLLNSAVALDPGGEVAAVADKSFLWHFDSSWFDAGAPAAPLSTHKGCFGAFVCADARMMEIPRRLALGGAELLIDCTALVAGPSGANAQISYMLAARAWENGVFLAVANKCGYEAGIAHYVGRSAIFAPTGERLAEALDDAPTIVTAAVDLDEAAGPPLSPEPQPAVLRVPPESLGISEVLAKPPPARPLRLAFVCGGDPDRMARELRADLWLDRSGTSDDPRALVAGEDGVARGGDFVADGGVFEVEDARVGVLAGGSIAIPERGRALMLEGCSVLIWSSSGREGVPESVLRTRADENRVFLVASMPEGWRVFGPDGTEIASGPRDRRSAVLVELPLALAWHKEMAPGTNVVLGRPR